MYLYIIVVGTGDTEMTNIKISDKGRAFLKRGNAAVQVATAIATKKNDLSTEEGVIVKIGEHTSITVRSAAAYSTDVVEA